MKFRTVWVPGTYFYDGEATHNDGEATQNDGEPTSNNEELIFSEQEKLNFHVIAEKARDQQRLNRVEMNRIILELCEVRYLTSREIALIMNRNQGGILRYLRELVKEDKLILRYPGSLNSKHQAYKTKNNWQRLVRAEFGCWASLQL